MEKPVNDVKVWLDASGEPIIHEASQTYQKGDMFCVFEVDKLRVFKYPLSHIWRVEEDYPKSALAHADTSK